MNHEGVPCEISVCDENSKIIATGRAYVEREDLISVAKDRCNIAFRVLLPPDSLSAASSLHVWADGVEISQRPIPLGQGHFDGYAAVGSCHAAGWIAERVTDFVPPLVTAIDQYGNIVMRCQSRRDDAPDDAWFSPARFSGLFDDACFGRGELQLDFLANGIKFAEGRCLLPLHGFLEIASAERCAGWLLSPNAPDRSFTIEICRDGKPVAKTKTDITRIDVQAAHPACRRSGFDVTLPPVSRQGADATTLSLRFPGSPVDLFEGPYFVGSRATLVQSARQVSRLALHPEKSGFNAAERAVLQAALTDFIARARGNEYLTFNRQLTRPSSALRLNVIIPVFKGVEITRACIESVLACRSENDWVVLIDDNSPDPEMAGMLHGFARKKNVFLLRNAENQGFVKSVNRALSFCDEGDVLLLNSDTRLFRGALDELSQVAHSSPDIGSVTALSSNATIFSYPYFEARSGQLDDIGWEDLADVALKRNHGKTVDVPTGHGFCLLIKREVLHRIGQLDESFGRGYGEENDLCARAADLGYRNVAAAGVLVEHRESLSFGDDKPALLGRNMKLLEARYPEYSESVREAERCDDLRVARWALDAARLERATAAGQSFALVICHRLGGGTNKAIDDIEATVGYGNARRMTLCCRSDGFLELSCEQPILLARFAADETAELLKLLSSAHFSLVIVHQVLGFSGASIAQLGAWLKGKRAIFYGHDYYPMCPRVTMIDAVHRFCNFAESDVCTRCLALSGAHEVSRLDDLAASEHRAFFADFLGAFSHIIVPSESAARYYRRGFPGLPIEVIPHPGAPLDFPPQPRSGSDDEIVLFGALGPHKGSAELLAIAHLARLTHPHLSFKVIGFTNLDDDLFDVGNVTITGRYEPQQLPDLVASTRGRLALFLSGWPETFSYTLTEAVQWGFIPLVPNIGAMADRVAAAGVGAVFEFPISPSAVLALISEIASGKRKPFKKNALPSSYAPNPDSIDRTKALFGLQPT
jgi:GT2 family glycosyltransferase/glycosyltransferase involved in cell wall biosynthesis